MFASRVIEVTVVGKMRVNSKCAPIRAVGLSGSSEQLPVSPNNRHTHSLLRSVVRGASRPLIGRKTTVHNMYMYTIHKAALRA